MDDDDDDDDTSGDDGNTIKPFVHTAFFWSSFLNSFFAVIFCWLTAAAAADYFTVFKKFFLPK